MAQTLDEIIKKADEGSNSEFIHKGKKYSISFLQPSFEQQNRWHKLYDKTEKDKVALAAKLKKDEHDNEFKKECRRTAMQTASRLLNNQPLDDVLKEADEIYQWLIKVIKQK